MHAWKILKTLFAAALLTAASPSPAQDAYPSRPVRIVVPYPPGGAADVIARVLAEELRRELRQQFIVENKGGAGGLIGTTQVARAAPDGYTLLVTAASHSVLPALKADMPYDTLRDLVPVAIAGTSPNMVLVRDDHPARTFEDFLRFARAQPDGVNFGTPGIGTTNQITAAMLAQATGIRLNHVPYKGSAPATQALIGGEVPMTIGSPISAGPVKSRLRALATAGATRSSFFPDVPTFTELKIGPVLGDSWFGMLAPAGTPAAVVERLASALESAGRRPEFAASLRSNFVDPGVRGPAEFARILQEEVRTYGDVARSVGIKAE